MSDLGWKEAIVQVLQNRGEPMHYTEIAEAIVAQNLKVAVGATPAASVNATISVSFQNEGNSSPFVRVGRGIYHIKALQPSQTSTVVQEREEASEETGLINALGMYWSRSNVLWSPTPHILGQQQIGSTPVDFHNEKGVYLLHDGRSVVYVGRVIDQPLGQRLRQHTIDRLNGRWDRFSWFGVYPVLSNGELDANPGSQFDLDTLIVTMEALLIEGLEPPQNRKRGDDFRAVEFLQVEDPEIQNSKIVQLMEELKSKFKL